MNRFRSLIPCLAALVAFVAPITPAHAQLDQTPQTLNAEATNLMREGQWGEALKKLNLCVEQFENDALLLYGLQFGVTWYRKGFCELRLGMFEEAMKSFEHCYTKYPTKSEEEDGPSGTNVYAKQALLRWGEAAQGAGQYEKAIELYEKYLKERDPVRDKFQPGSFYIQLAVCFFKQGKIPEGLEHFETALKNRVRYQTPENGILAAFQALVEGAIQAKDEEAVLGFLEQYRGDVMLEPGRMTEFVPLFLSLGGKAYQADLQRIAFALYHLVPPTQVMLDDIDARLARLGERAGIQEGRTIYAKDQLETHRKNLQSTVDAGDPHEVLQLAATAFLHEQHGNLRGANMCYRELDQRYPGSKKHEDHLFHLVRTTSMLGRVMETEQFGSRFLDEYPDSEHAPVVQRLMLSSLFFDRKYEQAIQVAEQLMPKLEEGTPEHDLCLHVLGGSHYYEGRATVADPLIDKHVEMYPESDFRQAALYFQASNAARLQYWSKAARLLDEFLEKYPDPDENIYLAFALYDRANAHFSLDENEAAMDRIARIESEFPDASVMPMTLMLKGNIQQSGDEPQAAEETYEQALAEAERLGNEVVAGEALFALISMLGEKPKPGEDGRLTEALPYIDKFWEDYGAASPFTPFVAVAQVAALKAADRREKAEEDLRDVIGELAGAEGAEGLEPAIDTYTDLYLEEHSAEELKNHFYDFPGVSINDKAARALLLVAVIGAYEQQLEEAGDDPQAKIRAEAGISVLFQDLRDEFDLADLSTFILVRVGDFIRNTDSAPQAVPFYDEVLDRQDPEYRFRALFGRAAVLAQGSAEDKARAIEDFERVFKDSDDRGDKDRALFQMIATRMSLGDYDEAKTLARRYLDREEGFNEKKPEVALMLARTYEELGQIEDAIVNYLNTAAGYKGAIRISAPASKRFMELLWQRDKPGVDGKPSDRQGAYNWGRSFTDDTRRLLEQMSEEEREMWREVEALVEQYVADPDVKSKEELQAEAAKR